MLACRKMKTDLYLPPYSKLKSRWIKDLNINTLNLIEKVGNSLEQTGTGDSFLNRILIAQALRSTANGTL